MPNRLGLLDPIWSPYPRGMEKPNAVKALDASVGAITCFSAALAGLSGTDGLPSLMSRRNNGIIAILLAVLSFVLATISRSLVAFCIPCSRPSGVKQKLAFWGLQIGCAMHVFVNIIFLQREQPGLALGNRGEFLYSLNDPKILKNTTVEDQDFLICYVFTIPLPRYKWKGPALIPESGGEEEARGSG